MPFRFRLLCRKMCTFSNVLVVIMGLFWRSAAVLGTTPTLFFIAAIAWIPISCNQQSSTCIDNNLVLRTNRTIICTDTGQTCSDNTTTDTHETTISPDEDITKNIESILEDFNLTFTPSLGDGDQIENIQVILNALNNNSHSISVGILEETNVTRKEVLTKRVQHVIFTVASQIFYHSTTDKGGSTDKVAALIYDMLSFLESVGPAMASSLKVGHITITRQDYFEIILENVDLRYSETVNVRSRNPVMFLPEPAAGKTSIAVAVTTIERAANRVMETRSVKLGNRTIPPNKHQLLNSAVVTISVASDVRLKENVTIDFNLMSRDGFQDPVCVSITHLGSPELETEGCSAQKSSRGRIICSCNHLTSFAVLMSVTEEATEEQTSDLAQEILTYICLALSMVCLFLSFVTFVAFGRLWSERNIIHGNLVACLFFAQLTFLVGIDETENKLVCAAIAGMLHLLFLMVFGWMAVEGLHIYMKLIIVHRTKTAIIPILFTVGYLFPIVIVAVSAIVNPQGYGTEKVCWLSLKDGFIYSFVGPVIFVSFFDFVMLCAAVKIMVDHTRKKTERPDLEKVQRWLRGAASLLSVFGVTWVFGCLALDGSGTKVFAYLFVIFSGSQGVFIFFFHCVLNDKVRREYRLVMRKMTWLPEPIQRCCLCLITSKATVDFDFQSEVAQAGTLSTFQSTRIKSTSRHGLSQQQDQIQPKQQQQPSEDQLNSRVQLSASQFSKPEIQSVLTVNQPIILPQVSSSPMNVSTSKRNSDGSAEKRSTEAD